MLFRSLKSVALVALLAWSMLAINVLPASAHAAKSSSAATLEKSFLIGQQTCASPPANFNP